MWRRLFRDVLESATPPLELGKRERQRYYVAYGFLFLLMFLGLVIGLCVSLVVAFGLISGTDAVWGGDIKAILRAMSDPEYSRQSINIWMPVMLVFGLLGFFIGIFIWYRRFIKSGYLSRAAVQRLFTNRAPTERGEGMRVAIGYVIYLLICFGLGIYMIVFGEGTLDVFTEIGLNGLGVYFTVHAVLRYRRGGLR